MIDLDAVLDGQPGSPRLSDLLKMAEAAGVEADSNSIDSGVLRHLKMTVMRDGTEKVAKNISNLLVMLKKDKRWKKKIWLNQFSKAVYFKDRMIEDTDYTEVKGEIESTYGVEFTTQSIAEACAYVAKLNARNPLVDWLNDTVWDGVPRLSEWVIRACGVDDTKLAREMGRKWMIQCVARAMEPGCKADCVLILIGPQGAKKSSTFRILASSEYFGDTTMNIGSTDAYMQIHRAWIYEVAELDGIRKAANSSVKAFLSAQEDIFRPKFNRNAVVWKRSVSFCGTTNKEEFITDSTGSRRFWPLTVGTMDFEWTKQNREQLWAEAVIAYKNGEKWWLEDDTQDQLNEKSSEYRQYDPWQEILERYITANGVNCSTTDLMENALKLDKYQMSRASEMRVGDIMRQLGHERVRRRIYGDRKYVWVKINTDNILNLEQPTVVVDNEDVKGR